MGLRTSHELLAKHYGFTEEELDFIINYDIKYRMGDELNAEEYNMGARYTHATKSLNETQHSHWDNGEFHNIASGVIAKRIGELYSVCMM